MKATGLLKKQHRKVEGLFTTLEKTRDHEEAGTVLLELANELAAHMAIEQILFYPTAQEASPDLIAESYQEHAIAEIALKRLLGTTVDDPTFVAKVVALKELISHHVDEEEKELFPRVDETMSPSRSEALAHEMQTSFEALVQKGYESLLPEGLETSADRDQIPAPVETLKTGHARKKTHHANAQRSTPSISR